MSISSMEVAAAIIGIEPDATLEEISSGYKMKARLLHPDRFDAGSKSQEAATESMKQLNEARDFMVANHGKPKTNTNNNQSQPSSNVRRNDNNQPAYTEPQEQEPIRLTVEEAEEERKLERKEQLNEEQSILLSLSKGFAIRLAGLIVSVFASFVALVYTYGNSNFIPLIILILSAGSSLFFLRRSLLYFSSGYQTLQNINRISSLSRAEERNYKRYIKARDRQIKKQNKKHN